MAGCGTRQSEAPGGALSGDTVRGQPVANERCARREDDRCPHLHRRAMLDRGSHPARPRSPRESRVSHSRLTTPSPLALAVPMSRARPSHAAAPPMAVTVRRISPCPSSTSGGQLRVCIRDKQCIEELRFERAIVNAHPASNPPCRFGSWSVVSRSERRHVSIRGGTMKRLTLAAPHVRGRAVVARR